MNFICNDKKLFKKYKKIWGKNRKEIRDKKPTYESNKYSYINTKRREYWGVIGTNFHKNKASKTTKEDFPHKCLSFIRLESIVKSEENFNHCLIMLEESKYNVNNIKGNRHINDELEKSASDE